MHILHVVQLYQPVASGAARYFIEIAQGLAREGHQVTVLATDAYDLEHLWAAGKRRVEQPEEHCDGTHIIRFPVRRFPGPAIIYPLVRRLMVELSRFPGTAPLLRQLAQLTPRLPDMHRYLRAQAQAAKVPFDLVHATNITLDFAILPAFEFARRC